MTNQNIKVSPYLFFDGKCEEALGYYQRTLGAQTIAMMRFKESPDQSGTPPGAADKVMHASFRIGETEIMASDGQCQGQMSFQGFALSLSLADVAEAQRLFNALVPDGQIQMPFGKTFFSPGFGMVTDRYGITWMLYVPGQHP